MAKSGTGGTPKKARSEAHKRQLFLAALLQAPSVADACLAAGIGRTTAYRWREKRPTFAAEWDSALDESTDRAEAEAYRRAVAGVQKPVFYKGEECGRIQEYSDTLLIFWLKCRRPEVYRDTVNVKHIVDQATEELEKAAHEIGLDEEQIDTLLELMSERLR